jgi:uncharacterized protein
VSSFERLASAVAAMPAIDHHAHVLARPGTSLAEILTESTEPGQVEAVREHPAHLAAVRLVAETLGVDPTEEAIDAASRRDYTGHVGRLVGECRLDAMFVDDGFRPAGALSLAEHASLVTCPVRRIVRVESEAEAASAGWPSLDECRSRLDGGSPTLSTPARSG